MTELVGPIETLNAYEASGLIGVSCDTFRALLGADPSVVAPMKVISDTRPTHFKRQFCITREQVAAIAGHLGLPLRRVPGRRTTTAELLIHPALDWALRWGNQPVADRVRERILELAVEVATQREPAAWHRTRTAVKEWRRETGPFRSRRAVALHGVGWLTVMEVLQIEAAAVRSGVPASQIVTAVIDGLVAELGLIVPEDEDSQSQTQPPDNGPVTPEVVRDYRGPRPAVYPRALEKSDIAAVVRFAARNVKAPVIGELLEAAGCLDPEPMAGKRTRLRAAIAATQHRDKHAGAVLAMAASVTAVYDAEEYRAGVLRAIYDRNAGSEEVRKLVRGLDGSALGVGVAHLSKAQLCVSIRIESHEIHRPMWLTLGQARELYWALGEVGLEVRRRHAERGAGA